MTGFQSKRLMAQDRFVEPTLIDLVIEQILDDIEDGDFTALEELLKAVPEEALRSYLPEV